VKSLLSRKWTFAGGMGIGVCLIIGTLLLSGVLPGATHPAHASNTESGPCHLGMRHSVCTGKGLQAYANFYSDSDCISTNVGVDAVQDVSNSATDPSAGATRVFVFFYQYDTCSYTEVANAEGELDGGIFQGDNQLSNATVNATVPLTGSGIPDGFALTIALNWHGIGDTRTGSDDFKFRSPSGLTITHTSYTTRSAVATGTVSDGTINYASAPALNSMLSDNQGGQIVINHP
jgi:hypothetical protein